MLDRLLYPVALLLPLGAQLALTLAFPATPARAWGLLVTVAFVALVLWLERRRPFEPGWNQGHGARLDVFLTMAALPLIMFAAEAALQALPRMEEVRRLWPSSAPFGVQVVCAILLAEFFFYWEHRFAHEIRALWRLHAYHHDVGRVYSMNSGRFHPLDAFLNFLAYFTPLVVLGVPEPVMAFFLVTTATTGLLEHANVDYEAGFLNYVFNTAQLHRWHHSADVAESQKNYGKILTVWDVLFRTHCYDAKRAPSSLGVG